MAQQFAGKLPTVLPWTTSAVDTDGIFESDDSEDGDEHDAGPAPGPKMEMEIWLAANYRES